MKRAFQLLSIPLALALLLASLGPALALDKAGRLEIMPAVVQVWWVWEEEGGLQGVGMGSGTLISPDGLVLTNHHVAFPEEELGVDYLGIALTVRSDRPPQPAYLATVVAGDAYLDLAVLRISHDLDMAPVRPEDLNLPFVELGDSDRLDVGDELNIFGYPGIGGDTVTFTKGVVSGFTLDAAIEGRAWVKTDTTIAGGNSGGTGVDEDGLLVGVPTKAGAGGDADYVDCRPLADTNGNGQLDESDSCVPIGGFLNALRPVNLAKPLIEAARLGLGYQDPTAHQTDAPAPTGRARFFNLQFSPGLTESQQPTAIVTSLPSRARSLYLFFDYENMVDGSLWEMKVEINGQDAPDWGLPAGQWSGGGSGTWWVGWHDATFVDGVYTLVFLVEGQALAEAEIQIGGRAQTSPTFANIIFSQEKTGRDEPVEPATLFPAGITRLYAFFDYENMPQGTKWTRTWLFNEQVAATTTEAWNEGAAGRFLIELTSREGLDAGDWRLELAIQGNLAARADFAVAGQQGGGALFEPFIFARDVNQNTGQPIGVATSFPSGLTNLWIFSDYRGMTDGLQCVSRVYLNGQKVIDSPFEWWGELYGGESGTWWNTIYAQGGALPDGEYTPELIVESQVVQVGTVVVGGGSAPAPTPTPPEPKNGVQVQGAITDLDTGRPIAGAFFLVLQPGITLDTFQWTEDEVYTSAETDRQGFYRLPALLERGQCYSMIFAADGYWPYGEDDVCIGQNASAVVDLPIQLESK